MRIGIGIRTESFHERADELPDYERAGVDVVNVPELYGFDAVSRLGYVAARTSRAALASSILPLYSRTPALMAMTAAGLDFVSRGRFELGIGTSGPQVIEGFHGVPFDAPVGRTREVIEICRIVWRREPLAYDGTYYRLPLPEDKGTGLGKALKMIDHPVRPDIPVTIAAIGPRNVALAAELASAWQPAFFVPERAADVWADALAAGLAKRDPALGPLGLAVGCSLAIGEGTEHLRDRGRRQLALYIGGMGARSANFYNNLACRYGYEQAAGKIQDLYLSGRKQEAEAAVPAELLAQTSLIGPEGYVRDRLAAMKAAGVTTLRVEPLAEGLPDRLALIERVRKLADEA
jgi:F420-dependent oxidoreductase-like protein